MKDNMKKQLANVLEDLIGDILTGTGCHLQWGEVELPECIRAELEEQ